jgi:hypothetical protein
MRGDATVIDYLNKALRHSYRDQSVLVPKHSTL